MSIGMQHTYDEMIAVIQAAKAGKQIQYRHWREMDMFVNVPTNPPAFNFGVFEYAVKREEIPVLYYAYMSKQNGMVLFSKDDSIDENLWARVPKLDSVVYEQVEIEAEDIQPHNWGL